MPLLSIDGDFFPGCDLMYTCVSLEIVKQAKIFLLWLQYVSFGGRVGQPKDPKKYVYIYIYIIYIYYYIIYKYIILYNILYYIIYYIILYIIYYIFIYYIIYNILYIIYYLLYIIYYILYIIYYILHMHNYNIYIYIHILDTRALCNVPFWLKHLEIYSNVMLQNFLRFQKVVPETCGLGDQSSECAVSVPLRVKFWLPGTHKGPYIASFYRSTSVKNLQRRVVICVPRILYTWLIFKIAFGQGDHMICKTNPNR